MPRKILYKNNISTIILQEAKYETGKKTTEKCLYVGITHSPFKSRSENEKKAGYYIIQLL